MMDHAGTKQFNQARPTILSVLAAIAAGLVLMQTGNAGTTAPRTTTGARRHIVLPGRTVTLPSDPHTAIVRERNGQSGIGLVEVYNLQNP